MRPSNLKIKFSCFILTRRRMKNCALFRCRSLIDSIKVNEQSVNVLLVECGVQTPGPGHYGLPRTDMYKSRAPGYTIIGRRTQSSGNVSTPGPASHCPDLVDYSLCYRRQQIFSSCVFVCSFVYGPLCSLRYVTDFHEIWCSCSASQK